MKIKDLLHLDPELEIVLWSPVQGDSENVRGFVELGGPENGSFVDPRSFDGYAPNGMLVLQVEG
jgi:hypothetical protein